MKLKTKETINDLDNSEASLKHFLTKKNLSILLWKKTVLIDKQMILFSMNSEMFCFSFLYLSYSGYKQSQTSHILLTSLILILV